VDAYLPGEFLYGKPFFFPVLSDIFCQGAGISWICRVIIQSIQGLRKEVDARQFF
jgi:hypothetical protein